MTVRWTQSALAAVPQERRIGIESMLLLDHHSLSEEALALGCRIVGTNLHGGLYLAKQGDTLLLATGKDAPL